MPPNTTTTVANGDDILMSTPLTVDTTGAALANVTCPSGHVQ